MRSFELISRYSADEEINLVDSKSIFVVVIVVDESGSHMSDLIWNRRRNMKLHLIIVLKDPFI